MGRALRALRRHHGLTLREVASSSGGRFTATGVAGYERGERAISLARFCDLVRLYGQSPDRVLRDVLRTGTGVAVPGLTLDALPADEARLVLWFVEDLVALREARHPEGLRVREGDLEILTGAGEPSSLLERVAAAVGDIVRRTAPSSPPPRA